MDIHTRKEAEQALSEAAVQKDQFLATLAHELRNPLAPIRNGLQLLEIAGPDEELQASTRAMMDRQMNEVSSVGGTWRAILWGGLALLLALPSLAMQFGAEGVDWSLFDFVAMGVLLAMLGLGVEAAVRFVRSWRGRLVAIGAVVAVFLLIWIELAVGSFGTLFAGS